MQAAPPQPAWPSVPDVGIPTSTSMFPYHIHPPCLTGRALGMHTNTAEDWDCPLQSLNAAVVTKSWSSVQEANQQQKKDILQARQENRQKGFGDKTESFEISETRPCEGVSCFPTDV